MNAIIQFANRLVAAQNIHQLCMRELRGSLMVINRTWAMPSGFEIIEILVVAHSGSTNDTLCTVERKI